jgi:predicted MarR family transcription regulator
MEAGTMHIATSQSARTSKEQRREAGLADSELGTVDATHAFQRWILCCMNAAGLKDLTVVDVLVLHHINHRGSAKRVADICFVLNIEDTHVVTYSLRKLAGLGVISAGKHGKEVTYAITPSGQEYLSRYMEIRERLLMGALATLGLNQSALGELALYLRKMSGLYDQAARAASSL